MDCGNVKEQNNQKERKKKRAEIEIYRPGALKRMKEAALKNQSHDENLKTKLDGISTSKVMSSDCKSIENTENKPDSKRNLNAYKSGSESDRHIEKYSTKKNNSFTENREIICSKDTSNMKDFNTSLKNHTHRRKLSEQTKSKVIGNFKHEEDEHNTNSHKKSLKTAERGSYQHTKYYDNNQENYKPNSLNKKYATCRHDDYAVNNPTHISNQARPKSPRNFRDGSSMNSLNKGSVTENNRKIPVQQDEYNTKHQSFDFDQNRPKSRNSLDRCWSSYGSDEYNKSHSNFKNQNINKRNVEQTRGQKSQKESEYQNSNKDYSASRFIYSSKHQDSDSLINNTANVIKSLSDIKLDKEDIATFEEISNKSDKYTKNRFQKKSEKPLDYQSLSDNKNRKSNFNQNADLKKKYNNMNNICVTKTEDEHVSNEKCSNKKIEICNNNFKNEYSHQKIKKLRTFSETSELEGGGELNESNDSIRNMVFIDVSTDDLDDSNDASPKTFIEKFRPSQESVKVENVNTRGIIQLPSSTSSPVHQGQKTLFNPNDPSKPVIVTASNRITNEHIKPKLEVSRINEDNSSALIPESNDNCKIDQALMYSIQKGEMDITYYVNSNQIPQEFRRIMDIRNHLKSCYKQLLLTDIRFCQEKNIEGALWKSLYYLIIEKLREYIAKNPSLRERSLSTMMIVIDDGLVYMQELLVHLQDNYSFSLDNHIEQDIASTSGIKNRVKQAINSCHKILLSLGDLSRYKEQYSQNLNFTVAQKWYLKARQAQPRNGRSYNQLAIIAVNQKRPLDIVYYYIRSLTADNPFVSARDSLISMFDDIRKKYNSTYHVSPKNDVNLEMKKQKFEFKRNLDIIREQRSESLREETWIRPDSGVTDQRTLAQSDPDDDRNSRINALMKLPEDILMKQFLTSYLHCHGMLFSRVGLDCFMEALTNTLETFFSLIKSFSRLSVSHIVQIVAINIFAIENTKIKDMRLDSGYRPAAQEYALLLAQEMFARICEVIVKILPTNLNYNMQLTDVPSSESNEDTLNMTSDDTQKLFQPQLAIFMPGVKVWCDWLLYNSSVWNPPAQAHENSSGPECWSLVAEFATLVKGLGDPDIDMCSESSGSHSVAVSLPEDNFLKGYSLLQTSKRDVSYISASSSVERTRDWMRLNKINLCLTQFLCGVEPPILRMQKTDEGEVLVPVVAENLSRQSSSACANYENPDEELTTDEEILSDGDADESFFFNDDDSPISGLSGAVKMLAKRKKMLEKKQKQQRRIQAIMEGQVTLKMEVRPRVLVPDTNCFIQHLDTIEKLVNKSEYEIMVPLIVIDELEGLSKDTAVEKYGGDVAHAINVREGAASALQYLRTAIGQKSSLKCVTSQGSILTSATFTDEVVEDQEMTNDDRILSCCIHFFKDNNVRRPIEEGVRRLYREVVLLTEDRNLRVKAYGQDLPVRNLIDFAHWAGIK